MAVGVGFEPTDPRGSTVFKTARFDRSRTPPHHPKSIDKRPICVKRFVSNQLDYNYTLFFFYLSIEHPIISDPYNHQKRVCVARALPVFLGTKLQHDPENLTPRA